MDGSSSLLLDACKGSQSNEIGINYKEDQCSSGSTERSSDILFPSPRDTSCIDVGGRVIMIGRVSHITQSEQVPTRIYGAVSDFPLGDLLDAYLLIRR